jgi:hypothetical protein
LYGYYRHNLLALLYINPITYVHVLSDYKRHRQHGHTSNHFPKPSPAAIDMSNGRP